MGRVRSRAGVAAPHRHPFAPEVLCWRAHLTLGKMGIPMNSQSCDNAGTVQKHQKQTVMIWLGQTGEIR